MTAPSIKEALELAIKFIESHMHYSQPAPDMGEEPSDTFTNEALPVVVGLNIALATFQPDGERREAIAREPAAWRFRYEMKEGAWGKWTVQKNKPNWFSPDQADVEVEPLYTASGLVQNEAGEPTTAMVDACVAFALNVSLSGEYRWSQYVADLYKTMRAAAIRSARDGGAET